MSKNKEIFAKTSITYCIVILTLGVVCELAVILLSLDMSTEAALVMFLIWIVSTVVASVLEWIVIACVAKYYEDKK